MQILPKSMHYYRLAEGVVETSILSLLWAGGDLHVGEANVSVLPLPSTRASRAETGSRLVPLLLSAADYSFGVLDWRTELRVCTTESEYIRKRRHVPRRRVPRRRVPRRVACTDAL